MGGLEPGCVVLDNVRPPVESADGFDTVNLRVVNGVLRKRMGGGNHRFEKAGKDGGSGLEFKEAQLAGGAQVDLLHDVEDQCAHRQGQAEPPLGHEEDDDLHHEFEDLCFGQFFSSDSSKLTA